MYEPQVAVAHRSVELKGRSAIDMRDELTTELARHEHGSVLELDAHRLLISHRYRPRWATIAAICLAPLLGLGLLLLLVRRNAVAELQVIDSARGAVVTVVGALPPGVEDQLFGRRTGHANEQTFDRPVLTADGAPADAGEKGRAAANPVLDATRVEPTAARPETPSEIHSGLHAAVLRVSFVGPTPDLEVRLGERVVIGRDPRPEDGSRPLVVDEAERTLSKSHAVIGFDEDGPYLEDLASTNGSLLQLEGRPPVQLVPGHRHRLTGSTARMQFGGVECVAVLEIARAPGVDAAPEADKTIVRSPSSPTSTA